MMIETTEPPKPKGLVGSRRTEPWGANPYASGGFGVLPRRNMDVRGLIGARSALSRFASDSPLRLLTLLPDLHPSVGLALWNALRLSCASGDVKIVATKPEAGQDDVDEEGTAFIQKLWRDQAPELGGFRGIQTSLTIQALLTGLVCIEAVPGSRMKGVQEIWPVDSLTINFRRDPNPPRRILPLQRQMFLKNGGTYNGLAELSPDTFFWRSVDAMVDDPYGRAPYATAVSECLCDLALIQDLRDAVHNAAWPRIGHGFNFAEMHKVASEVYRISDPNLAAKWVEDRFDEVVRKVSELKADDNLFYDSNGKVEVIEGGKGFGAIDSILEYLRQRVLQSLKTLPTLMGVNDGSTQTYTTVEWAIYAAGLESIRGIVSDLLCDAANLHLRLLGKPLVAVAKERAIRTTDGYIEAQAEQMRIENEKEKVRLGWITEEEASVKITGSGPAGPAMANAYDQKPQPAKQKQEQQNP